MSRRQARVSGGYFEAVFHSASDAIACFDGEGRFTAANPAFERLTGYRAGELLKRSFLDITPREYHASCRTVLARLVKDGPPSWFEKEYERKNGLRVPVRVAGFAVRDAKGRRLGYAAIARDITKSRRLHANTEAALREALSFSEAALESTTDGLLIVDRKGRMTGFNRRFLEMWRISKSIAASRDDDKALKSVLRQVKHPEAFLARVRELYQRPQEESFDSIEFKDGRVYDRYSRPQRIGREIVGRVWSFRDATQSRRLERELAQISGREQARIGGELHDSIGQTLTAISLLARAAGRRRIEALSHAGLRQVRSLARGLLPPDLQSGNLQAALGTLETGARELFGASCAVSLRGRSDAIAPAAAVELYRIAQEAVYNAAKHSRGKNIDVFLDVGDKLIRLTVADDGVGLPRDASNGSGLGLAIMRYRARLLGGTLELLKGKPGGTRVVCECPRPR